MTILPWAAVVGLAAACSITLPGCKGAEYGGKQVQVTITSVPEKLPAAIALKDEWDRGGGETLLKNEEWLARHRVPGQTPTQVTLPPYEHVALVQTSTGWRYVIFKAKSQGIVTIGGGMQGAQ